MGDSCIMWCPNLWLVKVFLLKDLCRKYFCGKILQKDNLSAESEAYWGKKSLLKKIFVQKVDFLQKHLSEERFCSKMMFLHHTYKDFSAEILRGNTSFCSKSYCRKYFWWSHCRKYFCGQHRQREDCLHLDTTPATLSLIALALCNQKQWRC